MLLLLPHTSNDWFHFSRTKSIDNIIKYNLGKNVGCAKQYICAYALYLMSVIPQCYSIIIDWGISAPGNGKEVVDGLNAVDKRYIYQLMSKVQLPASVRFES